MLQQVLLFIFISTFYLSDASISITLSGERNPLVKDVLNNVFIGTNTVNNGIHQGEDLLMKTFQYYGKIEVGTPKQPFYVSFSTMTSYVAIPSINCTQSCGPKNHRGFNESASLTFYTTNSTINNNPLPYTNLKIGYDVVEVGGVAVKNQTIGLITDGKCDGLVYDGVVGLGFSVWQKEPTFLDNLYTNKMIPQNVVGLRLNRNMNCKSNCGELVIGGWNNAKVDSKSIRYIQAQKQPETRWKIVLDKVLLGTKEVCKNRYAYIDISSSFLRIPEDDLKIITNATGMIKYNNSLFLIDKSEVKNLPSLTINIDGKDYTLHGSDYVDTVDSVQKLAIVLIKSSENTGIRKNEWILGNAFIGKYYTILDYQNRKVAFANINSASSVFPLSWLVSAVIVSYALNFWVSDV